VPTIVANSIGSGKTYTTVALWEADGDINLVTEDKIWKGEVYGELVSSATTTLSGATTDSTRYKWLTAASGESFADNANKLTNALYYNASNGAALRQTSLYTDHLTISENYAVVSKLQIKNASTAGGYTVHANATNVTIRDCIIQSSGYSNTIRVSTSTAQIINSLIVSTNGGDGIRGYYAALEARNCTVIRISGGSPTGIAVSGSSSKALNCAIFNFSTIHSGTFASGSGNNATNGASAPGSSNQTSLTFADQFESSTNDFRAKGTGSLPLNGVADSTYTSDLDIVGQTRSTSTPTIGCWEYISSGGTTDGVGSLSATGTLAGTGASNRAGVGALAATGTIAGVGASNRAGVGSLSATGTISAVGADAAGGIASGVGSLAATGTIAGVGAATYAGVGSISAAGTVAGVGASTFASVGSLSASGLLAAVGASNRAGVGALSASGIITAVGADASSNSGAGILSATGTIAAVGASTRAGVGALSATFTLLGTPNEPSVALVTKKFGFYIPDPVLLSPDPTVQYLLRELQKIQTQFQLGIAQTIIFHTSEPNRPYEGMMVGADGTEWNPGSGRGIYARVNSAWVKLG